MSTGSSGQDLKYTSFDRDVLGDGRRSNESPAPTEQRSDDKMKAKKAAHAPQTAAHAPQTKKQAKKGKSKAKKSASLILKYNLEFGHANVRSPSVWCRSRTTPPKEPRSVLANPHALEG